MGQLGNVSLQGNHNDRGSGRTVMNGRMMISRRRLLSLTAAGVSVAAIGGLRGVDRAYAADKVLGAMGTRSGGEAVELP